MPPHERVAENRRFGARGRLSPTKEAEKTELKPVSEYVYGNSLIARNDYKETYSRYGYASGYVTGNREYYGQDILGSTMLVTNGAAGVVQKYAYDAYGNNYEGSFAGSNNIGYNSKKYDGGTGWYDYGFRDYDSRTGRFTTVDPIRDGMNWYAYCGGDPINCIDLLGWEATDKKNTDKYDLAGVPPQYRDILIAQQEKNQTNSNLSDQQKPVFKTSIGVRGALIIGGSASIGVIVNPNNYWDSGITVSLGIGTGLEAAVVTPLNDSAVTIIDMIASSVDFSNPTSTADIEGVSNTAYASAGIGISTDLDTQKVTGITTGSVGGGVYKEVTVAITGGKIAEGFYNTGVTVINGILNSTGMSRLVGNIKYKELDGIE